MREDGDRWDARYAGRLPDGPAAPEGLDGIALPERGRCLDVACGLGQQSIWAAQLGYEVTAIDSSPVAIGGLLRRAGQLGLAGRIDGRLLDLDDGIPADVAGRCALVICQRFRDPALYPDLVSALRPGGVLVITVLSSVGAAQPGPYHAPPGELQTSFCVDSLEILRSTEGAGESTLVARRR